MKVSHTYPTREIVLIRIAEEANRSGCMITIGRSCSKHVLTTGANDGHKFCIKVLFNSVHSWKVVESDTSPEPAPVTKTDNKDDQEECVKEDNDIVGEEGNPDDDNDDAHDDDDDDDDDDEDGDTGE